MKESSYEFGKFCASFDPHILQDYTKKWYGIVEVGYHRYETNHYKEKDYAMSEVKGYLEGLMIQMKEFMEYIDNELKKGE